MNDEEVIILMAFAFIIGIVYTMSFLDYSEMENGFTLCQQQLYCCAKNFEIIQNFSIEEGILWKP